MKKVYTIFTIKVFGLLLLFLISIDAFAYDFEVDGYRYTIITSSTADFAGVNPNFEGEVVIPEYVLYSGKQLSVNSIGERAFEKYKSSFLRIPQHITIIKHGAFVNAEIDSLYFENSENPISLQNTINKVPPMLYSKLGSVYIERQITITDSQPNAEGPFYFSSVKNVYIGRTCSLVQKLFQACNNLEKVIVKEGSYITSISSECFYNCFRLKTIDLKKGLSSILSLAFYNCTSLDSIYIPSTVTSISSNAFSEAKNIKKVVSASDIPVSIDETVFSGIVYLSATLYVPDGTKSKYETTMGWREFVNIVEMKTTPTTYTMSITALGNGSASYGGTTIRNKTSSFTLNAGSSATINFTPDNGYRIKTVKVNNSTVSVSNNQYTINNMNQDISVDVEFEETPVFLSNVEVGGFYYNLDRNAKTAELTYKDKTYRSYSGYINIPSSVFYEGNNYIVTSIGEDCFSFCNITSVTIPQTVTHIGIGAFNMCDITSIIVPNSVNSINHSAFYGCRSLTKVTISEGLLGLSANIFAECSSLTSVIIPNNIKEIGAGAFKSCSNLSDVSISTNLTSIGNYAFSDCESLSSVIIPSGVNHIGYGAFMDCRNLDFVNSYIETPYDIDNVFSRISSSAILKVPQGTKSKYQALSGWANNFKEIVESSNDNDSPNTKRTINVTTAGTLPDYISDSEKYNIEELILTGELNGTDFRLLRDMAGCNYLGNTTEGKLRVLDFSAAKIVAGGEKYVDTDHLPGLSGSLGFTIDYANELPQHVFNGCKFVSITLPTSLISIGNDAFYGCSGLTSITIPNGVMIIGYQAFRYCSGLTSITIPNSVTSIGYSAFESCSGLTSITIPNSVTSIGDGAFSNCSGLTSITIPNSLTSIGDYAFRSCSGLTLISVSGGNTIYDSRDNCNAIIKKSTNTLIAGCKNTVIPNSVTSIGNFAFSGCSGLTSLTIPNSVMGIGHFAFSDCSGLISITIPNSVTSIGDGVFCDCI